MQQTCHSRLTAVSEYELAVLNIFTFNMLVFQYVW